MQAAEEAGQFSYSGGSLPGVPDDDLPQATTDLLADRLLDLDIGKPISAAATSQLPTVPLIPQKASKPDSTARPLTTDDDDDIDFDLELDENIDTTVSLIL